MGGNISELLFGQKPCRRICVSYDFKHWCIRTHAHAHTQMHIKTDTNMIHTIQHTDTPRQTDTHTHDTTHTHINTRQTRKHTPHTTQAHHSNTTEASTCAESYPEEVNEPQHGGQPFNQSRDAMLSLSTAAQSYTAKEGPTLVHLT